MLIASIKQSNMSHNSKSMGDTESEISFKRKVFASYRKYTLSRENTFIHHGIKNQLIKYLKSSRVYVENEDYTLNDSIFTKMNDLFLDIKIQKNPLALNSIKETTIKERLLIFPVNNKKELLAYYGYFKFSIFFSKTIVTGKQFPSVSRWWRGYRD